MNLPRTFQPTGCELIGPESPEATTFAGSAISTSKPSRLDLRAVSVRDHTESATTGHSIQRHGAGQSRSSATWPCFRVAAFLPEESWGPGPTFSVQSYVQLATEQNTLALGWSVCSKRFQIFCNPQCCWNLQNRLQCPGCYCGRPKQSKPNSHPQLFRLKRLANADPQSHRSLQTRICIMLMSEFVSVSDPALFHA